MNHQILLTEELLPFPVEPIEGESGPGFCLRALERNGTDIHTLCLKLRISGFNGFRQSDAVFLSQLFKADVAWFKQAMPASSSKYEWQQHRWYRASDLRFTVPQVCPICVHRKGWIKAAWDFSLSTVCIEHQCALVDACSSCPRSLSWYRPAPGITRCRHVIRSNPNESKPDGPLLEFQSWVETRLGLIQDQSFGTLPHLSKWQMLKDVSLPGWVCLMEAFGLKPLNAVYQPPLFPPRYRSNSTWREIIARALERIEAFERLDSENLNDWKGEIQQFPLLRMATVHQHSGDLSLAAFLLEKIFAYRVSVRLSKRHAHWGQMRLFEV